MNHHRINDDGDKIVCAAPEDAHCRHVPACDTEFFTDQGCSQHEPRHPVLNGRPCWMAEGANAAHLTETHDDWRVDGDPIRIRPGAAVDLTNRGEDGIHWTYATPPAGWSSFGTQVDQPDVSLEFSAETSEDGLPLWERPGPMNRTDHDKRGGHPCK